MQYLSRVAAGARSSAARCDTIRFRAGFWSCAAHRRRSAGVEPFPAAAQRLAGHGHQFGSILATELPHHHETPHCNSETNRAIGSRITVMSTGRRPGGK